MIGRWILALKVRRVRRALRRNDRLIAELWLETRALRKAQGWD